ncbi:hypothetical protein [Aquibium microcysteis]|uniref:hypothetical protein n=1 Tax=Aquibium microcysteis TaxID=675281 RepID=UPI00165D2367|nr:hypothetical protein [Aquibium microcysteis]
MEAELFDGTILEFPEGTAPEVIARVAKQQTALRQGAQGAASAADNTPAWDRRDARGVPGGQPMPRADASPAPTFGDRAMQTSAGVLGSPIDMMSEILAAVGAPTSETPFMGSRFIEGTMQQMSGRREAEQIAASSPGVALDGGAPIGERVYSSFLNTPEAQRLYLTKRYGQEGQGWYRMADRFGNPTDRIVTRAEDGTERLFNPPGIDLGDIAGMAGGVPDVVGAVGGAAASVPAYAAGPAAGIPASAALSATGAQLVGESVGRMFPENRAAEPSIVSDVLPRAGGELTTDAIIGLITGGGMHAGTALLSKARAPFAASASDPMAVEYRAAADRLQRQGYDIAPLPSEGGAGGFIPRVEGLLEKLPGSSEKMRQYRESGDRAVDQYQRDLTGGVDPNAAGREAVAELGTQRQNLVIDREQALGRADDMIDGNERALTARQGPEMSAEAAGRRTRSGLDRSREQFRSEAKRLYDIARAAPGGMDPIVDMTQVRDQVKRIRDALPPSKDGGASSKFAPPGLSRFLTGVDEIAPQITIDQARQMRTLVSDAIEDKGLLPGVPERYLEQLRQSLSRAIDGSVATAGSPELRSALRDANTYYAKNIDRFSRKGVVELYRDPTNLGYVEDNRIVERMLSGRGNPGVIRETRDLMGAQSPEWASTRRNAVEQILGTGRSETLYGRRLVNANGLVSELNRLDDETVRELFGVKDATQLRNLAADVSNRSKYLDADALSAQGTPNILGQLRAAAAADDQIAREYRTGVIAPFLRGESGAAARMKAEELVPWLYRRASPDEARMVLGKMPPDVRANVERGIVADIVESSITKGRSGLDAVRRLVSTEANPADAEGIAEILGAGGDSVSRQQAERVNALLSPDTRQALRDLAVITARRQERDATTSAIGGLAAGAAITGILSRPASAIQAAAISRGLAQLVTNPGFRQWMTNTKRISLDPVTESQAIGFAPAWADVLTGALAEDDDVQAAMDWIGEGVSQVDEIGQRTVRPPSGAETWEDYFRTMEAR